MELVQDNNRSIVHLDLDAFFVSVECLHNSDLKGKPLIVGGKSDRGVVAACSYEARAFGVSSAMPMKLARRLCPDAIIISGDMESYSKYSSLVTDIIREQAPLFEKSSIDEFYLDVSGMDRFFGCYKWATELRQSITKESGLPISFGLSLNKMISKVATGEAKPNGQLQIKHGDERNFLAPMPIEKIPLLGKQTAKLLRRMGIDKISRLRAMPAEMLEQLLGKNGVMIWQRANGIDRSPVVPYSEAKSISTERTFDSDTINVHWLRSVLVAMGEKLGFRLRESGKLCSCITVKIRYSNFDTVSKQMRIPYSSCDHTLIKHARDLFEQLYDRRLLIRLVGVRLSGLVNGHYQIDLFEDTEELVRLYQAIDKIKTRYGSHAVMRARGFNTMKERPEMNAFHG